MSEQPKASEAKHTPKPWRWGFWKLYSINEDYVFRPASEARAHDDLILSCGEYGNRSSTGWFKGAESVLCATTTRRDGGEDATICVSAPDMALIAAAPVLLAVCEEAERAIREMHPAPPRDGALHAARMSCVEIIQKARETR